ncbi:MAG: hypothetical protein K8R35_04025 [Bacteroidales bacterium]|nr:hypothetical protein [Bacteroidales bacterium]
MKKIFILGIVLFYTFALSAQDSYIGINLGSSLPQGDFADTTDLFSNGFTLPGFSIQFDGIYYPMQVLGFGGMLGFGSLYTDYDRSLANLKEYIENHPNLPGIVIPGDSDTDYTTGFWNYVNLLAGPELSAPIGRFQIGIRAMGGLSMIFSPKRKFSYENSFDKVNIVSRGASLSLAYLYGGSIMFKLSPGSSIRVAADYFSSNADYDMEIDVESVLGQLNEIKEGSVNIETIQLSLGLSYYF